MSTVTAVGHAISAAFRRNTNSWGGAALACGAGHGLEIEGHTLAGARELIRNNAMGGGVQRLPGVAGNKSFGGDIGPCPLYYRGLETLIALVMGTAGVPTTLAAGAYKHVLKIANTDAGKHVTFVVDPFVDSGAPVHEYPCLKIAGFTIDWQSGQKGMITFQGVPFDLNFNTGSPVTNRIVAAVDVANGAYTIANQPATPSPINLTITDANASITEHVITFVGTDRDDRVISEVYTLSVDGLTWTSRNYFKTITTVTGSGTTGAVGAGVDQIVVGVTNGVNNATTVANITLPSERDFILFSQLDAALFNLQSAGALTASTPSADNDEFYLSGVRLQVSMGHSTDVYTSKFGDRINEPRRGGADFAEVTLGLNFRDYDSRTHAAFYKRQLEDNKARMKGSLAFLAGYIGATAYQHAFRAFFNNLQVNTGTPTMTGPGLMPFDLELFAHKATATPTGFTSGYTDAVVLEMQSSLSTDPLA